MAVSLLNPATYLKNSFLRASATSFHSGYPSHLLAPAPTHRTSGLVDSCIECLSSRTARNVSWSIALSMLSRGDFVVVNSICGVTVPGTHVRFSKRGCWQRLPFRWLGAGDTKAWTLAYLAGSETRRHTFPHACLG